MQLVLQVLAAAQALEKSGQRLFKPYGLSVPQFNVLNLLSDQREGMRASDLARALIVDPSNVTGLLRRMHRDGYLRELANRADKRQHIVALSPKGRQAWQGADRAYRRALAVFEKGVTPSDQSAAQRVLQQILAATAALP